MANWLQKLAFNIFGAAQKKAFGSENTLISLRAKLVVEFDHLALRFTKELDELKGRLAEKEKVLEEKIQRAEALEAELRRQLEIMSWATMSPQEAAKARRLFYAREGISDVTASVLQFPQAKLSKEAE
jgi:hypothetical protein